MTLPHWGCWPTKGLTRLPRCPSRQMQQTPRPRRPLEAEFIRFITKWNEEFVIVPEMARILG